jgi:hypothetical protein
VRSCYFEVRHAELCFAVPYIWLETWPRSTPLLHAAAPLSQLPAGTLSLQCLGVEAADAPHCSEAVLSCAMLCLRVVLELEAADAALLCSCAKLCRLAVQEQHPDPGKLAAGRTFSLQCLK